MHSLDSFVITTCKNICPQYIFGVVIPNIEKAAIFPFLCFMQANLLGDLNIQLIFLSCSNKIDLTARIGRNYYLILPAQFLYPAASYT